MSGQNTLIPNLTMNGRKEYVKQADINYLVKGVALLAGGILAASCITTELSFPVRGFLFCVGAALCVIGVPFLLKFYKEVKAFKEYVPQWDKGRGIFDRMAKELNAWYEEGEEPESCDGDTHYYLKLQKERLEDKGLQMQNEVLPVKGKSFGTAKFSTKSAWYTTDMLYEEISRELRVLKGTETLYQRQVEQVMYEIVVHTPNEKETDHLMITCPNCGAVSPVAQLMEGWPVLRNPVSYEGSFSKSGKYLFHPDNIDYEAHDESAQDHGDPDAGHAACEYAGSNDFQ